MWVVPESPPENTYIIVVWEAFNDIKKRLSTEYGTWPISATIILHTYIPKGREAGGREGGRVQEEEKN